MVFIDTMKTFFLKNHKQHQSIFGANSIKEFPRRRASLKKNSDERIESLEDAASHEKRENRQVCAGKFRSGARWALILSFIPSFILIIILATTLFIDCAQAVTGKTTTTTGLHFVILIYIRASYFCVRVIGMVHTHIIFFPLVSEVGVVEFASVWKYEVIVILVGRLVYVFDRDFQPDDLPLIVTTGLAPGVDCSLCFISVFTVKTFYLLIFKILEL